MDLLAIISCLLLVCTISGWVVQTRFFLKKLEEQEAYWRGQEQEYKGQLSAGLAARATMENLYRQREHDLVDRLLKQAKVQPLQPNVQVENVVKLPDPEMPSPNWIDEAFKQDEILEMIESRYPELVGVSVQEVQQRLPLVWNQFADKYEREHMPLRVGS